MQRFGIGGWMMVLATVASLAGCVFPSDDGSQTEEENAALNSCGSGRHRCGRACASNKSVTSCGPSCIACPVPANAVATCNGTVCDFACSVGFHACGGTCVSNTSTATCGNTCNACVAPANGVATCNGTACGIACEPGFTLSGGNCI